MRLRLIVAVIAVVGVIAFFSVPTFAPVGDTSERALLPAIESGQVGLPVIHGDQVTFYAEGAEGSPPRVVSDLTGWGEKPDGTFDFSVGRMHQIAGTRWFALSVTAAPSARVEYLFAYGAGDYRVDPRNPRKAERVGGDASEFVMPGYVAPPEFAAPPSEPAGRVTEAMVTGATIGRRHVIVYTPPGYDASRKYRLAVFHDGDLVVNKGEAPRVLDWLIGHDAIHPVVAVFVEPASRADDFRRDAPMREFVAVELMRWISANYSVTPLAADHAIIGISAGARAALDAMTTFPGVFGRSGLMIPALDESDLAKIPRRQGEAPPLDVVVLAATYDRLNHRGAELARDAFAAHGHSVKFVDVAEGHSTITWKTHLRDVMTGLFGR